MTVYAVFGIWTMVDDFGGETDVRYLYGIFDNEDLANELIHELEVLKICGHEKYETETYILNDPTDHLPFFIKHRNREKNLSNNETNDLYLKKEEEK